jgi:hypothetical protein
MVVRMSVLVRKYVRPGDPDNPHAEEGVSLRDAPQHEGGMELPETAVHSLAREELARSREEWPSMQAGQRFGAILARRSFSPREVHEIHESHEESAPMPMASGSEAIPHES